MQLRPSAAVLAAAAFWILALFAAAPEPLKIDDAWIHIPPPGARTTAAYFSLRNDGKAPVVVKSVQVAGAAGAEMHETTKGANGAAGMKRVEALKIMPAKTETFAPGGMHIMVFGLPAGLTAGATVDLVLKLEDGREIKTPLTARAQ